MPVYKLNHAYEAYRDGRRFGPWAAGDQVVLDEADAEWVERDSAGALTRVAAEPKLATALAAPVPAAGAQPRVGGDPDRADAAAAAQERVHAEAKARQTPPADEVDDDPDDEAGQPARQKRPVRDRQQRGGRNRSG